MSLRLIPIHHAAVRASTDFAGPFPSVSIEDRGNLRAEPAGGFDVAVGAGSESGCRYEHVAHLGFCHAAVDEPVQVLSYLLLKLSHMDSCRLLAAGERSLIGREISRLAFDVACHGFRP